MIWLFVALFVIAVFVLTGGYVFFSACLRRKELPWLVKEEIEKTSYGKYYAFILQSNEWLSNHRTENVYMESDDGLRLHGLWIPAESPKGTILFAHGYRSTYLVDFGMAMEFYHNKGMNLLIPDQRCHGKSEGKYITFGVKESRDMAKWIRFHNDKFGNHPIILSGLSMGASTMLYLADQALPDNVRGIIADCGFTSPRAIIGSVFTAVTHLPSCLCMWITDIFARLFAGFGLSEKDTIQTLSNSRYPVFMIHGTDDGFVPCEMTQKGFAVCNHPKKLLLVDGADHGVSFVVDRETYTNMIEQFLKENL